MSEEAVATNGVASGGDGDYDNIWQSDELYAKVSDSSHRIVGSF